jgi:hypothetical protein
MPEQQARIVLGTHELEAACQEGSASEGVVLCHPHPLYGGSMDNNVIMALKKSLTNLGWTTLRFNFRGVGASGGSYGDGPGEVEDLLAAVEFLRQRGLRRVHMAGYSFGAWITLRACQENRLEPATLILVSPPLDFLDFTTLGLPASPTLITLGDADSFCSVPALQKWLDGPAGSPTTVRLELIRGCDHFYWGRETILGQMVHSFESSLTDQAPGAASEKTGPPAR